MVAAYGHLFPNLDVETEVLGRASIKLVDANPLTDAQVTRLDVDGFLLGAFKKFDRERLAAMPKCKRGLDAVVAVGDSAFRGSNHANVYWLTNWLDLYAAYAVIPLTGDPFLVISNELYLHTARRAAIVPDVFGTFTPGRAIMAIAENLEPGMPEYELSAHIQASFLKDGGALMFHFSAQRR